MSSYEKPQSQEPWVQRDTQDRIYDIQTAVSRVNEGFRVQYPQQIVQPSALPLEAVNGPAPRMGEVASQISGVLQKNAA